MKLRPRFLNPRFYLFDTVAIIYLCSIAILIVLRHNGVRHWQLHVGAHAALVLGIVALIWLNDQRPCRLLRFPRYWYGILLLPLFFREVGALINVISPFWFEPYLISADRFLFGGEPLVLLGRYASYWLTEISFFSYWTYFPLLLVTSSVLYIRGDIPSFARLVFRSILSFFLCYWFFLFFPARGAWETLSVLSVPALKGGLFTSLVVLLQSGGSISGGAFPSSHVAVAWVVLFHARETMRWLFWLFLPMVLSLHFSIVYTRYHYAVDAIGGALAGILCFRIALLVEKWTFGLRAP